MYTKGLGGDSGGGGFRFQTKGVATQITAPKEPPPSAAKPADTSPVRARGGGSCGRGQDERPARRATARKRLRAAAMVERRKRQLRRRPVAVSMKAAAPALRRRWRRMKGLTAPRAAAMEKWTRGTVGANHWRRSAPRNLARMI